MKPLGLTAMLAMYALTAGCSPAIVPEHTPSTPALAAALARPTGTEPSTLAPRSASATPTTSPGVSPTPNPPSLAQSESPLVADVLLSQTQCELPCWRGVSPGESTATDLAVALQGVGVDVAESDIGQFGYESPWFQIGGPTSPVTVQLVASMDQGVVRRLELWFQETADRGGVQFRRLDALLGTPTSILFFRPQVVQRVFLDYAEHSALVRFSMPYHGEVCMSSQVPLNPVVVLYGDGERETVLDSEAEFAVDWAVSQGITTGELWHKLQDQRSCIPPAY